MTLRISQSYTHLQQSFKMSHAGSYWPTFHLLLQKQDKRKWQNSLVAQVTSPLGHTAELSVAMKEKKSCLYSEGYRGSIQLMNRSRRHPLTRWPAGGQAQFQEARLRHKTLSKAEAAMHSCFCVGCAMHKGPWLPLPSQNAEKSIFNIHIFLFF